MPHILGHIEAYGARLRLTQRNYHDENLAITLESAEDGEPYGTLTVNLPESTELARQGEFAVKTWSENEAFVEPALASGLFVDTGKRIRSGFVDASVWRLAV